MVNSSGDVAVYTCVARINFGGSNVSVLYTAPLIVLFVRGNRAKKNVRKNAFHVVKAEFTNNRIDKSTKDRRSKSRVV
jgi:hypothetical protein